MILILYIIGSVLVRYLVACEAVYLVTEEFVRHY
jgi:hypothetical protein